MRVARPGLRTILWIGLNCLIPFTVMAEADLITQLSVASPVQARMQAHKALIEMGPEALPILLRGIKAPDRTVRVDCIGLLGKLGAAAAVPELSRILTHSGDPLTVVAAAYALGWIQDPAATEPLLETARDLGRDAVLRAAAVKALGSLGDRSAEPELLRLLEDREPTVRALAAGALGELGNTAGLKAAQEAAASPMVVVRLYGIQALGAIGLQESLPTLQGLRAGAAAAEADMIDLATTQVVVHNLTGQARLEALRSSVLGARRPNMAVTWAIREILKVVPEGAELAVEIAEQTGSSALRAWVDSEVRIVATRRQFVEEANHES